MNTRLSDLKEEFGNSITGNISGYVQAPTAEKIRTAIASGHIVHVGSRSIGDCMQLRKDGRMISQTNSRRSGLCQRAIYVKECKASHD